MKKAENQNRILQQREYTSNTTTQQDNTTRDYSPKAGYDQHTSPISPRASAVAVSVGLLLFYRKRQREAAQV